MARVIVVDSHPLVRWALVRIAADHEDLSIVGEAATAEEALALANAVEPDVVTIDCSSERGWTLVDRLRNAKPTLGIVVLTSDDSDQMLFRALKMRVSAFVSQSAPIPDVIAAIRHAGAAPQRFIATRLAAAMRRKRETEQRALSPRELEILLLLHEGKSVPQVAAQLFVSLSTAKTYVARLYDKLGASNRAQALMAAVRHGLLDDQLRAVI